MNLSGTHIDRVYFLGIGGIGMSALARYFRREGLTVSGYDRSPSVVTKALEGEGIPVFYEQDPARLTGMDLIIYTPAVPADSPEMIAARSGAAMLKKRAEILGLLSLQYQTLAVAGTHGKTTTSTMLAHLLRASGIDASAFLGGLSRNLGGNFVHGHSPWMVTEADEYDRSFLHLHPHTAVITSVEPDHLDIYGDPASMLASYQQFAAQAGHVLVHQAVARESWATQYMSYGVEEGDIQAKNLKPEGLGVRWDFHGEGRQLEGLYLPMPGQHNVMNATAALALALRCGASPASLAEAVASFSGIYRRFEVQFHEEALSYVDDYAHHPTEITAAIDAAREYLPGRQVVVVFQPHLYTRTRDFAAGFAEALAKADEVLLMDIYPARELPIAGVDAAMIAGMIPGGKARIVSRSALPDVLRSVIRFPGVVLSLGAGDIDKEVDNLRNQLKTLV